MRAWHDRYERSGLTIIGVHTPEFLWEKPLDRLKTATEKLAIQFPVVQDNDFENWNRYGIRAWPTLVVIDKRGVIRYRHIGEGAYPKTESVIERLLAEAS